MRTSHTEPIPSLMVMCNTLLLLGAAKFGACAQGITKVSLPAWYGWLQDFELDGRPV